MFGKSKPPFANFGLNDEKWNNNIDKTVLTFSKHFQYLFTKKYVHFRLLKKRLKTYVVNYSFCPK